MPSDRQKTKQTFTMGQMLGLLGLLIAVLWSYVPTLATMADKWSADPQYSHGYLVPVFAAVLLWLRWDKLDLDRRLRTNWWGIGLLLFGSALRLVGAINVDWFDGLSLLPTLAGICLLIGGMPVLRWSWPAIGFLIFMIPLPYTAERAMSRPLRRIGTTVSTYVMQTVGLPAIAKGNIIHMGDHSIGVAEACSGLRMLVIFFALSTAVALLIERNIWVRMLVVASAIPIALIANIVRITVTGALYELATPELAKHVFHDLAGWLMMPLGLAMLWFELWLLSHLFIADEEEQPLVVGLRSRLAAQEEKSPPSGKMGVPLT